MKDENTYTSIGLNKFLRSKNSPIELEKERMSKYDFDPEPQIQMRRLKLSSLSVQKFIRQSNTLTATASNLGNGDSVVLTTTLDPDNLFSDARPLGVPQISIYQGDAADDDNQIYPRSGSNITPAAWVFDSGFDWGSAASDGTNLKFMVAIENISAGTVNLYIKLNWAYIQERDGVSDA